MSFSATEVTTLAFWTPANLALVTSGHWLAPPRESITPVTGISIDSRSMTQGQAFLAIKGERFDGHNFAAAAIEAGAAMVIVQRDIAEQLRDQTSQDNSFAVLLVDDTLLALQQLAAAYRDVLRDAQVQVIAVAGSNGKTTTRHLIHSILDGRMISQVSAEESVNQAAEAPGAERPDTWRLKRLQGTQAPGSFNNHIGVPLTLLAAKVNDDFVVVEIGTNHMGETNTLAHIVRPNAAVMTSVGHEHLEFFHDVDHVAEEQAALLEHVIPGGVIIIEHDAMRAVAPYANPPANHSHVTFGTQADNTVQLLHCDSDESGIRFSVRYGGEPTPIENVVLPLLGKHNAMNALAAIAVARWMGVDNIQLNLGMLNVQPIPGRLQTLPMGHDVVVIHDAYNANPDSMRAAIDVLMHTSDKHRRVAILGDMFELGAQGPDEHQRIGRYIRELGNSIGLVIVIGQLAGLIGQELSALATDDRLCIIPQCNEQTPCQVAQALLPGDRVLIKASRGIQLEQLIPAIRDRFGEATAET
jgi:UDP-N-acetylmuramoyl-tripeptide--D-alanyl-D-alanine ligase